MSRVPCKICGAEILAATASRNQGLCGRCSKGHRPCIHCGGHVNEPLHSGVYAHIECSIRNRHIEESLGWRTVNDIDWQTIRQLLHRLLMRLFENVAPGRQATESISLVFYVHVEDFIDIIVYETQRDGSSKRLSTLDPDWDKDLSPLASSYSIMCESLTEQAYFESGNHVISSLTGILSDECNELTKLNFCFPENVQVSWRIKTS